MLAYPTYQGGRVSQASLAVAAWATAMGVLTATFASYLVTLPAGPIRVRPLEQLVPPRPAEVSPTGSLGGMSVYASAQSR